MATLSLRMRDDLKRKAQDLAQRQGVSLEQLYQCDRRSLHRAGRNSHLLS